MEIASEDLAALCQRFHVRQLDLFGSAADGRFDPARSDLDFLVTFDDAGVERYSDAYFGLLEGLTELFGRKIDLVNESSVENPYLRHQIKMQRRKVYPAA